MAMTKFSSEDSGIYRDQGPEDILAMGMVPKTKLTRKGGAKKRWPVQEHNLLIDFYNKKIHEERADGTTNHTWREWDREASLYLLQNGYSRSAAACGARWTNIQKDQGLAGNIRHNRSESETSDDEFFSTQSSEPDISENKPRSTKSIEPDTFSEQVPGHQEKRVRAPRLSWSNSEKALLVDLVISQRKLDAANSNGSPGVIPFWKTIAAQLQEKGSNRTLWQAKRCYENIEGEQPQARERKELPPQHEIPDLYQHQQLHGDLPSPERREQSREVGHLADHASKQKRTLSEVSGHPDQKLSRRGLVPGRKVFTPEEKLELDDIFQSNPKPQSSTIERLANKYKITSTQMKAWFSNRRFSEKQKGEDNIEQSFQSSTGEKRNREEPSGTDELGEENLGPYSESTRGNKPHIKKARVGDGFETQFDEPVALERSRLKIIEYNPVTGNIKRRVGSLDPAKFSNSRISSVEATAAKSSMIPNEKSETFHNPARGFSSTGFVEQSLSQTQTRRDESFPSSSLSTSMSTNMSTGTPPGPSSLASTISPIDHLKSSGVKVLRKLDGKIQELSALERESQTSLDDIKSQLERKKEEFDSLEKQMSEKENELHGIQKEIETQQVKKGDLERMLSHEY